MNTTNRKRYTKEYMLIACLGMMLFVQAALGGYEIADPRTVRIEWMQTCVHTPDKPCRHARILHVDNRAPNASDDNDGAEKSPFKTINQAAQRALPGDTVLIADGVYREHVSPAHSGYDINHMITYKAKNRHKVFIKGSELWHPKWRKVEFEGVDDVWQANLDPKLFSYDFPIENFNPFKLQGYHVMVSGREMYAPKRPWSQEGFPGWVRGMIIMDGRPLRQAQNLLEFAAVLDIFFVSADGNSVYARFVDNDPQSHFFEITTREQVFAPKNAGVRFIHLKGLVMEHAATGPSWTQYSMVSPTGPASHWIFEDNAMRWSFACALDIGGGYQRGYNEGSKRAGHSEQIGKTPKWSNWIKGNEISDNGQAGIWGMGGVNNVIIEYNRVERNGWLNNIHMIEAAGVKLHVAPGALIRGNLVRDNDNFGIWLDVAGHNLRVTQNLLINNMTAGVFIEDGWGEVLIDNNIAAFTRTFAFYQMNMGDGFYSHQGSNVTYAHNLSFANNGYGYRHLMWGYAKSSVFPDRVMRVSGCRVLNNIAYANGRGAIALPLDQPLSKDNRSDYNFIWGASSLPLFELHRVVMPPSEMVAKVEAAIAKAGVGADQVPFLTQWKTGEMGPNVADMRHFGPLVSLPVWQAAQQNDLHSVIGPLPVLWLTRDGQMQINLNIPETPRGKADGESDEVFGALPENYRRLQDVKCQPIPEVICDYFGNPRPKDAVPTVGPFQDLKKVGLGLKEEMQLQLWPIDRSRQPDAETLRLDRPQKEMDEEEKAAGKAYMEMRKQRALKEKKSQESEKK